MAAMLDGAKNKHFYHRVNFPLDGASLVVTLSIRLAEKLMSEHLRFTVAGGVSWNFQFNWRSYLLPIDSRVCICVCVCAHVYVHMCTHTCVSVCAYVCTYVHVCMHVYMCAHACLHV